jgi:hypothetical protein
MAVIPAEFEERSYEAPLYNQLERGNQYVYTPGQVLESKVGFDRGLFFSQVALWQTLGYKSPLRGAALAYYDWPYAWGPAEPRAQLPKFRLNLFLQAKRPDYYERRPRSLKSIDGMSGPLWGFKVTPHQQKLLEVLAQKTQRRAHVAYAAAVFHTNADLFGHTKRRTIVQNSTFPSAGVLSGHDAWYYRSPGATGAANPNPERIEEPALLDRVLDIARGGEIDEGRGLGWLDPLARSIIESAGEAEGPAEGIGAHFFDDLQMLGRLAESYELPPEYLAFAQINLFTIRFDVNWLLIMPDK